jgi:phage shock protein E
MPSTLVQKKLDAGAIVIDVRTPEEFRFGAYPGALNIPIGKLGSLLDDFPKEHPVVLYCASGIRSASAALVMKIAGFTDVIDAGGLTDML